MHVKPWSRAASIGPPNSIKNNKLSNLPICHSEQAPPSEESRVITSEVKTPMSFRGRHDRRISWYSKAICHSEQAPRSEESQVI